RRIHIFPSFPYTTLFRSQRGFIGGKWHVDFFDPVKGCTGHAQRTDPAGGDGGGEGVVVRGFRGINWRWIDHGIPFHVSCSLMWTALTVMIIFFIVHSSGW